MKNYWLAPSIMAYDFKNLEKVIKILERGKVDLIHLDIMDGHFVPNITIGPFILKTLKKLTKIPIDAHLMISNPEEFLEKFIEEGADWIIVHYESTKHLHNLLEKIKKGGRKRGVAINPLTPVEFLEDAFYFIDLILIMGVNPGFSGQEIIESTIKKVKKVYELREKRCLKFKIAFDGGVNLKNAKELLKNGCDILMVGSEIFSKKNILKRILKFKNIEVKK